MKNLKWIGACLGAFGLLFHLQTQIADGSDSNLSIQIDTLVNQAIVQKVIPGAVVIVGRDSEILHRRAYGNRSVLPIQIPNSMDTLYDLASLTKPLATATSILILLQNHQLELESKLSNLLPEAVSAQANLELNATGFNGLQADVTIEELLRHRGGFAGDSKFTPGIPGDVPRAWQQIFASPLIYQPNTQFVYSDIGFLYLGKIVEKISGLTLDQFSEQNIFGRLNMKDTSFRPFSSSKMGLSDCPRCAPTEKSGEDWLQGRVQDPWAQRVGGVAGHSGLFSTADDLAIFCQMLLGQGTLNSTEILSKETYSKMLDASGLPPKQLRGLGWDIDTPFSSPRGDLFQVGGFGHTGYTGTSIWIDPKSETYIIILTNRLHPADANSTASESSAGINLLRKQIANAVAQAVAQTVAQTMEQSQAVSQSESKAGKK